MQIKHGRLKVYSLIFLSIVLFRMDMSSADDVNRAVVVLLGLAAIVFFNDLLARRPQYARNL